MPCCRHAPVPVEAFQLMKKCEIPDCRDSRLDSSFQCRHFHWHACATKHVICFPEKSMPFAAIRSVTKQRLAKCHPKADIRITYISQWMQGDIASSTCCGLPQTCVLCLQGHWCAAIGQLPVRVSGAIGCNQLIVASLTHPQWVSHWLMWLMRQPSTGWLLCLLKPSRLRRPAESTHLCSLGSLPYPNWCR